MMVWLGDQVNQVYPVAEAIQVPSAKMAKGELMVQLVKPGDQVKVFLDDQDLTALKALKVKMAILAKQAKKVLKAVKVLKLMPSKANLA